MDNSRCQNDRMATGGFDGRELGRAEHPRDSPDLSRRDFWLVGFLKEKLKDHRFCGVQSLHQAITDLWDELTFEDVQVIFPEWMNRPLWVIENKGEYFIK
jgi:hypothetical protein